MGVGAGVGIGDGLGVGLGVESEGVDVGAGVGFGVDAGVEVGAGVAVGPGVGPAEFFTMTETDAVPSGEVPPWSKTRTVRVCAPSATWVESHVQLPVPDHTLVPSTIS